MPPPTSCQPCLRKRPPQLTCNEREEVARSGALCMPPPTSCQLCPRNRSTPQIVACPTRVRSSRRRPTRSHRSLHPLLRLHPPLAARLSSWLPPHMSCQPWLQKRSTRTGTYPTKAHSSRPSPTHPLPSSPPLPLPLRRRQGQASWEARHQWCPSHRAGGPPTLTVLPLRLLSHKPLLSPHRPLHHCPDDPATRLAFQHKPNLSCPPDRRLRRVGARGLSFLLRLHPCPPDRRLRHTGKHHPFLLRPRQRLTHTAGLVLRWDSRLAPARYPRRRPSPPRRMLPNRCALSLPPGMARLLASASRTSG